MSTDSASQSAQVNFADSMTAIDAGQWNRLAGDGNPFLRHEFLLAMERSGCATAKTGWRAQHVTVTSPQGKFLAAMPLYLKNNSWGEYVFDFSWAEAYQTHGQHYYPKLLTAVPFTPSSGSRILVENPDRLAEITALIIAAVKTRAAQLGASSWHVLFPIEAENQLLQRQGLPTRLGCQFHWFNPGYESFEDFLATLSSRKRKNIRKERAAVQQQGIRFECIEGAQILPEHWEQFFQFYQNTYLVRGRTAYLNLEFFQNIGRSMADDLLLLLALQDGEAVAGALFLHTREQLFGRYWGCEQTHQFLHFETCYYQGIDYCIRHGLKSFDAGAQGEHKIQRGFRPISTWSNHWIAEPVFARAIGDFLDREQEYIRGYMEDARSLLPFRQTSSAAPPFSLPEVCAETPEHQD